MAFDERKDAAEKKFELDQQTLFKIEARASKLIGIWAGEKMGMSGAELEAYAKEVVVANLDEPGYDDVKRKLVADFSEAEVSFTENEIDHIILKSVDTATHQIAQEAK
ncbi:MAG: DUF1476 domain-containing protein [Pseudobdellovibrionaceae bacterium]|jgi:hypothetical protein|nr:DUF1476 domain-containing protein [Pseudobdellovibrionaceae bacterium]